MFVRCQSNKNICNIGVVGARPISSLGALDWGSDRDKFHRPHRHSDSA